MDAQNSLVEWREKMFFLLLGLGLGSDSELLLMRGPQQTRHHPSKAAQKIRHHPSEAAQKTRHHPAKAAVAPTLTARWEAA